MMRLKLRTTDISLIEFEKEDGTMIKFGDLYEFQNSIGYGGFGFVIQALYKKTKECVALKVVSYV
jgi:serine/threonine protein kinase